MEFIVFFVFVVSLVLSIVLDQSILYVLMLGYLLFFCYGLLKSFSFKQMIKMSLYGIKPVKSMLTIFLLIGMITAIWRAAGTIPMIISLSAHLIIPSMFIVTAFLLNCFLSFLTGTAFGTAATIGVICMTIGHVLGANPLFVGGAILSGVYFGDRCSPMSTSALLISELTRTNIFENIKRMMKSSILPFMITCVFYIFIGLSVNGGYSADRIREMFSHNFNLSWLNLIPAIIIIVLSLCKMNVKLTMISSILLGSILCFTVQHLQFMEFLKILFLGFKINNPELAPLLNGGGIVSMLKVMAIVLFSSLYAGIFIETGILNKFKLLIFRLADKTSIFSSSLVTSIILSLLTCNQTLSIMLTHQICNDLYDDKGKFANTLEDTAVVVAPLVPWSIAATVPIASISAPTSCLWFACYLYLIPLVNVFLNKKNNSKATYGKESVKGL